jgi:predicted transcriptional regulator
MPQARTALTLRLATAKHERLREIAEAKDIPLVDVIRLAIDRYDEEERRRERGTQDA